MCKKQKMNQKKIPMSNNSVSIAKDCINNSCWGCKYKEIAPSDLTIHGCKELLIQDLADELEKFGDSEDLQLVTMARSCHDGYCTDCKYAFTNMHLARCMELLMKDLTDAIERNIDGKK